MTVAPPPAEHGHALLRAHLLAGGGEPAAHVRVRGQDAAAPAPRDSSEPGPPQWAASGPHAAADPDGYELALELVLEGYRLHYATPTVLDPPDADLALLLGDRLYAEGLALLTALGDLPAILELAEVIALSAQAHAAENPALAQAAWLAAGAAVGFGASTEHLAAQAAARAGEPGAAQRLRDAAHATLRNSAPVESQ